ncbi:MAG: zinc-dependent metalloprotease family protein [Planctomycetota bacterium]
MTHLLPARGCRAVRSFAASTLLGLFALAAAAQEPVSRPYQAPPTLLQAFAVTAATVQHVVPVRADNGEIAVEVEFGGAVRHLVLRPHDVRSTQFQLLARDENGLRALPRPANVTYRGSVLEDPNSWVAATIVGDAVQAVVHASNGAEWAVQPVREAQPSAPAALHIVYRTSDNQNLPWVCGVQGGLTGPVAEPASFDILRVTQIALEADFQYYQLNGSNVTTTQNDITGVINAMDAIYQNDVQLTFSIVSIVVNTSSTTNPYTTSVAGTLLSQFQSNWNANYGSTGRDVAHLFTGRNMGQASGGAIGIAFVSTICNLGAAYGVSQSRWTTNFTRRVAVTAHEIGHNFSAQHCDAAPPCYIMCSGIGGCQNVQTTFSQNERNQIIGFTNSVGCLAVQPIQPQITAVTPSSVKSFQPGTVTLTGQGFLGTTQVQIGSVTLTNGFTTPDDATLRFNPPVGTLIGSTSIQTTNATGVSNQAALSVTDTFPVILLVNGGALGGNNLTWNFGGTRNNLWVLAISGVGTTSPLLGLSILDSPTVLTFGLLDPINGLGTFSTFVPANTFSGQRIYSQIVELDTAANLAGYSSSAIGSTLIFN